MKFLGLLRKYANALKVGTMAGVVVTILWMLFMVVPTPPVNLSANFALWTWAVLSLVFWVFCRLVVTEKAMRFIGRVVGEPHIYGRWSNPGDPEKLADRYTSLVDNPHVIHSLQGSAATTARPTRVRPEERAELLFISSARGECGTHLYARDMDGSFAVDGKRPGTRIGLKPQFVLELLERPPGIVGPTMALALWLAVVTWVVGIYYPTVFPATTAPVSAWPAVIFGVPALVAGWLLSKLTKDVLRVISMRTFLCVAWVAVDSAFVVTLAALKTTGVSLGGFSVVHSPTSPKLGCHDVSHSG